VVLVVVGAFGTDSGPDQGGDRSVVTAQAGDCLHDANRAAGADNPSAEVTVVPCGDSRADYQVVARVASMGDGSAACAPYRSATKWLVHQDTGFSFVLCLAAPGTVPASNSGGSGGSAT
jgi:hypothetical protein